jgi:hypothetical protein
MKRGGKEEEDERSAVGSEEVKKGSAGSYDRSSSAGSDDRSRLGKG